MKGCKIGTVALGNRFRSLTHFGYEFSSAVIRLQVVDGRGFVASEKKRTCENGQGSSFADSKRRITRKLRGRHCRSRAKQTARLQLRAFPSSERPFVFTLLWLLSENDSKESNYFCYVFSLWEWKTLNLLGALVAGIWLLFSAIHRRPKIWLLKFKWYIFWQLG